MSGPLLLLPLLIPAVLAYFFQVRPKQARAQAMAALQERLRVGDRVVNRAGLHATVTALGSSTVDLEVCPGSTHRYERDTVVRLLS